MSNNLPTAIAIIGPTCTGKTALSIKVAKELGGEIIACDSRTIYRHMDVGTAKPSVEERGGVPHYMFDVVDPDVPYTVAEYKQQATDAMNSIFARGLTPIICGGTGFYARALLEGLEIPEVPPQEELRSELRELAARDGNEVLFARLRELDPVTADRLNANDLMRVVRAIEVSIYCQKPFSEVVSKSDLPFSVIWIGLRPSDRDLLRDAISRRFEEQLRMGLVSEVEHVYKRFGSCRTLLNTVNYTEFIAYIDGKTDFDSAKAECLTHNNQLARRQLIWFKTNSAINWYEFDRYSGDQLSQSVLNTIWQKR
ncbi:MAG TPA: tRNA (adenosine(37)-N6)-dimethylallyltransferase MiaA [Drouetiella sp.]